MAEYKNVKISKGLHEMLKRVLIWHPDLAGNVDNDVVEGFIEGIVFDKVVEVSEKYSRVCKRSM